MGIKYRIVSAGPCEFVNPDTSERFVKELHFWPVYDRLGTFNSEFEVGIVELGEEIESVGQIYWPRSGGIMYEIIIHNGCLGYVPKIGGFTLKCY